MKKNVNIVFAVAALTFAAGACATSDGSHGLVSAPMLPGSGSTAEAGTAPGPSVDAGVASPRALPPEPHAPDRSGCKRTVSCYLPTTDMPPWPLPRPFEHCLTTLGGRSSAKLSVKETTAARAKTPGTCCYVDFDCPGGTRRVIRTP